MSFQGPPCLVALVLLRKVQLLNESICHRRAWQRLVPRGWAIHAYVEGNSTKVANLARDTHFLLAAAVKNLTTVL